MSKKYVPQGSFLYCDKGVFPTPFLGLEYSETYLTDVPIATDYDNKPIFNILPFGVCSAKAQICLPAPTSTWNDPSAIFCGLVAKPILDDSTLSCVASGTIKIAPSFMAALLEMYDDPKELLDKFLEYMGATVENSGHSLWGMVKGAWGTLKFLGTLAIETSPIIQGYQALTDWEGFTDKWQGRYETAEDMVNFGIQLYELQHNPAKQAQLFAYLSDGDNWEAAFEAVYNTVAYADHTEVAEVQGMIAFEILLEVLTGGWGAARHIDKVDDLADGARIISGVMDNLDDPARLAENLEDLAVPGVDNIDTVPGGQTLDNVYHVKSNEYAQGVLDNIDPQYFNRDNRFADGFYVALEGETAVAEVAHHGGNMAESSAIRFAIDESKLNVLDLTDPNVADAWNYADALSFEQKVELGQITDAYKYEASIDLADRAREQGYNAIQFPSRRAEGGTNIVIFETPEHAVNDILSPEMIMPATD